MSNTKENTKEEEQSPNGIFVYQGVSYLVSFQTESGGGKAHYLILGIVKPEEPRIRNYELLLIDRIYPLDMNKVTPVSKPVLIYDTKKYASYMYMKFTKMGNREEAEKWQPLMETIIPINKDGDKYA